MSTEALTLLGGFMAVLVLMGAGVYAWVGRTPTVHRDADGRLPLFSDDTGPGEPHLPMPSSSAPAVPAPPRPKVQPPAERPTPTIRTFDTTTSSPSKASSRAVTSGSSPAPNAPVSAHDVPGSMVEGHLLRFSVPAEGTLQFLPGRLEIAAGRDAGREIRFVRVPGPDGTVVTFGRSDGERYRHIQLRDQTVSRAHARMRLLDSTWHLMNLSGTNPVVHNGRTLSPDEEQGLGDGDRIEMGEVLFTFRTR
ncbi:MAG TPA: FHA domain-containing protein [Gemmatimonas sp.]|nr:FHA domain-containing protein [Gemmatimonas sp.]